MSEGRNKRTPLTLLAYCCLDFLLGPENGGNKFLRNVAEVLPAYITSHSKRKYSSRDSHGISHRDEKSH
jgi:hypothetical protein